MRFLLSFAAVGLLLAPVSAIMVAFKPPVQRAVSADAVIVGKVTSVENETVEVKAPKGTAKTAYRIAVVKVENALMGGSGLTHVKVGFIPAPVQAAPALPPNAPPGLGIAVSSGGRRQPTPELKVGDEFVFFLAKHPTAGFYFMPMMSPPIAAKSEQATKIIESTKKLSAVLADPTKGLKSEKPEDRFFAAATLLAKYRSYPDAGSEVDQVAIPAEESKLILSGLLDGDWNVYNADSVNGQQAVGMLGITPKEGYKYPMVKPGQKVGEVQKQAFATWFAGPGKDFVVKKFVPKAK